MPAIATEKKLRKMLEPLLENGESVSCVTFQGGFKKSCLAGTTNGRLLVSTLPFFGSKATLLKAFYYQEIEKIDLNPGANYGYLSFKTEEESFHFKIASGLFDTFGQAMTLYTEVLKAHPDAAPDYLPDDEDVTFMVYTAEHVIKLTGENVLCLAFDAKSGSVSVAKTIPAASLEAVDYYPSKLTASFFRIKAAGEELPLKLTGGLSGRKSVLEALAGKTSLSDSEELYARLLAMNPDAHPEYLERGEQIVATARIGHTRFTISGGSLLRATGSRLLELEINKEGPLAVKASIPFSTIRESKLTTIRNQNSVQYELKIRTDNDSFKFVAPDEYEEAMKAVYEVLPG